MKKVRFILFAALLLAACQPGDPLTSVPVETLVVSADEIVGVWWYTQARAMIEFKADGTSRVFFGSDTYDEANYTFEDGKVTWATSNACKDIPATYEAYLMQDGDTTWLRMQVVGSDPCKNRAEVLAGKAKFQNP